jgi:tRNA (cytidine/uridine-2'-O-)-methyltransferase
LEKPLTRVYSSPKPTQPDNSTRGDASFKPQNSTSKGKLLFFIKVFPSMFKIVLYQPEIPPNTGNIIRLCANSGSSLHLIHPLGFGLDEKSLRRAGLDYTDLADVREYKSTDEFLEQPDVDKDRIFACSTRGSTDYAETKFRSGDVLLFGPETRGLPQELLDATPPRQLIRIPMCPNNRSLNLSNAVSIILFEAWRQQGFYGAE